METIKFEDFKKIDLRSVKVLAAERVSGSEKLLKLMIDTGAGERQIIAGIGKAYTPEEVVGKKIIAVLNLESRSLMGEESQGMLLAATDSSNVPVLIVPEKDVEPGAQVR